MGIVLDQVQQYLIGHLGRKDGGKGMIDIAQHGFIALGNLGYNRQAAAVGNGFIADQLSIFMEALADGIVVIIRAEGGRQLLKSLGIFLRPPVLQPPFTIILTAVGVKGMRDFMADDDADTAEIGTA